MNILKRSLSALLALPVDWWANGIVFLGSLVIANLHPIEGFSIAIVGQCFFIYYGIIEGKISFVVFNILYMGNSLLGILRWYWAG